MRRITMVLMIGFILLSTACGEAKQEVTLTSSGEVFEETQHSPQPSHLEASNTLTKVVLMNTNTRTKPAVLSPTSTQVEPNQVKPSSTFTKIPEPASTATSTRTSMVKPDPWGLSKYGPIIFYNDNLNSLQLMNANGPAIPWTFNHHTQQSRIEFTDGFSWSPDGKSVAYNSSSYDDIYVFSVKDLSYKNLTYSKNSFELGPDFSHDGRFIAFSGDYLAPNKGFEIYTMNADGSGITQLTTDCGFCHNPDWSPDGQYIVYANWDDGALYRIKANGSDKQRITTGGFNNYPTYSPDGKWIAFFRSKDVYDSGYIYIMPATIGSLTVLTADKDSPRQFSWSPDSKYIVYDFFEGAYNTFGVINVDLRETMRLGPGGYAPEWSPLMQSTAQPGEGESRADCSNGWTRLAIGKKAQVIGTSPNRVRSAPAIADNLIGEIYRGTGYEILDGPVCVEGLVFWQVKLPGSQVSSGWTAEGDLSSYFLEPIP